MQINTIFFDLDGTLYGDDSGLWDLLVGRIHLFMQERVGLSEKEISETRLKYLKQYGTTLRGLHIHYNVDPQEYLAYVHDIPIEERINKNHELEQMLKQLRQKKWIWTNASKAHAERVLNALGVRGYFRGIVDIERMAFQNKPEIAAYTIAMDDAGELEAKRTLFIDDRAENLAPAKELGSKTILVGTQEPHPAADASIMRIEGLISAMPGLVE